MIELEYDPVFEKQVARLEIQLRNKLAVLLTLIVKSAYDPRLHTKALSEPFLGMYAFRITRDWRVTFFFKSKNVIRLLEVKHRKDIYR